MYDILATRRFQRTTAWIQVALLILAALIPAMATTQKANAYSGGVIDQRIITMEDSTNGATGVSYEVSFQPATNHTIQSISLQYCSDSPIINDSTCDTTPTFDWNGATASPTAADDLASALTIDTVNSSADYIIVDLTTPEAVLTSETITFTLDTVTNPNNTNTSFYVRIFTWTVADDAHGYTPGTTTNVTDAGGIALSTTNNIVLTTKVQETLTFCVYTGANCAAGGTAISLGDANDVLSTSINYEDSTADFDLATNATDGATVYMSGTLPTSGANDINSQGTTCTADSTGTEAFGLRIDDTAATNVSATAPYNCAADNHAFDTTPMTTTSTPWGDQIASTSVPTDTEVGTFEFAASISATTPAGIYTATYDIVAAPQF